MEIHPIARIHSDFRESLAFHDRAVWFRSYAAVSYLNRNTAIAMRSRGLEDFSHLWLIWEFSETIRGEWSPTVRPPKLGRQ